VKISNGESAYRHAFKGWGGSFRIQKRYQVGALIQRMNSEVGKVVLSNDELVQLISLGF
jgi:hypothetical protein